MNTIELSVNDYKAISKADIALDGITVLSGVNGSGKSSLSKLLYFAFKYANAFEDIPSSEENELWEIYRTVHSLRFEPYFRSLPMDKNIRFTRAEDNFDGRREYYVGLIRKYLEYVNQQGQKRITSNNEERIKSVLSNLLNINKKNNSLSELLEDLEKRINELNDSYEKRNLSRPYTVFKRKLEDVLGVSLRDVVIKEFNVPFVGKGVNSVPIMHYVQNVVYIDTPMIVGVDFLMNGAEHWEDLQSLLGKPRQRSFSKKIFNNLKDDIIHGESAKDDDRYFSSLRYNREDGQSFPLFDSATGIKSFSILQMLLRNGVINKNTLLIIDEPEAHLHPQWIVEYARLVVQMHKTIGTKFFIASHSTDFVSAIRYIAAKQRQLSSLNFYLSQESKEKAYMFYYLHLGKNIEPIFASFNKSYDKLSEYGA